jgi:hypothetical protein
MFFLVYKQLFKKSSSRNKPSKSNEIKYHNQIYLLFGYIYKDLQVMD